jgi:DHA3 family tetracycline resistance protein-like MFS transporter
MTRTERTYYLVFSLYNLSWSFIGPMYALFLLSRGLDLFQMSAIPAVYWIVSFLFNVPAGAFADLAGRKLSFLLSCVVRMVAFGLYAYGRGFADFAAAEFVDALGSTLATGALDAWAVDGMQGEGDERPTDRFFARAQMMARTAIIGGGLAGGYLAQRDMSLPWLAAAGAFAITGIVAAVVMREVRLPAGARAHAPRSLVRTIGHGLMVVRHTPVLLLLCGLTFAVTFATMPAVTFWQPRLTALTGEGTWLMGWIWALLNVAGFAGSAIIARLLGRYPRHLVLGIVVLWRGVMLGVAGLAGKFGPALAGLLLMEVGFGVSEPLLQAWMNEHIAPAQRATVLSVRAMCLTLGGGLGLICIGLVARDVGIPAAWLLSAVLLVLMAPGFVILERRARATASLAARSSQVSAQPQRTRADLVL